MEKKCVNDRNGGFSMVEMLAVVAILVILLGISIVSVVRYRDLLEITELDNAAREIYMAAENRAVLLSGARRLSNQVDKAKPPAGRAGGGEAAGRKYVSKSDVKRSGELLKLGSIDPELMDGEGDFYIVYDLDSGSVTDVLYAKESMDDLIRDRGGFDAFYSNWPRSRSERLKLKDTMLVGWYDGQAAEGGFFEPDPPKDEPQLEVIIKNEEELTVTVVMWWEDGSFVDKNDLDLVVKLGNIENLNDGTYNSRKREEAPETIEIPNGAISYTWVLDSLTAGKFQELGNTGIIPGDEFTVTATVTSASGAFEKLTASGTSNSLFQEGSGLVTDEDGKQVRVCYIRTLRHLQNLDRNSGVPADDTDAKIRAVQTENILGDGGGVYPNYDFIPIFNSRITEYNGRSREIRNLHMDRTDDAGLFSKVFDAELSNIRMVNATVKAEGNTVGALVGEAHDTTIKNCWVYWTTDETVTDLKAVLGSDAEGSGYNYQISGKCAGGLVGCAQGKCTITGSLAATLVSGTDCAGGLVGEVSSNIDSNSRVIIRHSYADCYLTGDGNVAGLIGNLEPGRTANLLNCYAAGYILGEANAAGLCLGNGITSATNVYSVMRYPDRTIGNTFTFLTGNQANDGFTNTHFLGKEGQSVTTKGGAIESTLYADMTNKGPGDKNFATIMAGQFEWKQGKGEDAINSNPYNLREYLTLYAYSFPGLENLPHYGDWGAEFKEPSLVYYEEYSGDDWGVSGGNARDLINNLSDTKIILSDGYGVAFLHDDLKADSVTVRYTYLDKDGETVQMPSADQDPLTYKKEELIPTTWTNDDGSKAEYYMIPLPDELVNSGYAQDCFYRYLSFELHLGEGEPATGEYFYNPHFAETVVPVVSDKGTDDANKLAASMGEIKVRTPRHLHDLSRFEEYYNNARRDKYRQMLDLDYSTYTGYDQEIPYVQQPIGSPDKPFVGTYKGDSNTIENVVPEAAQSEYVGLFGYTTGELRDIVYDLPSEHPIGPAVDGGQSLYIGGLAGWNGGTIDNCAVSGANLEVTSSGTGLYIGGLTGWNGGTIGNCVVSEANLEVNGSGTGLRVGGLAGVSEGEIDNSVAWGTKLRASARTVDVGGLVGKNDGRIENSEAEFERLSGNCSEHGSVSIGGLVGENGPSGAVMLSYSVGLIAAEETSAKNAEIYIGGFAGWNSGRIMNSYAAVVRSGGENKAAYAFCAGKYGQQSGNVYLDQGNFSYRGGAYLVKYKQEGDKAQSKKYAELTKETIVGMEYGARSPQKTEDEKEPLYPYPAVVKDKDGKTVHYGRWPTPMPLGDMGVFYWEKMVDASDSASNPTYHMSTLMVNAEDQTITKQSTLSTAHDDDRVITEYGYGYYYHKDLEGNVTLNIDNITYTEFVRYNERENFLRPQQTPSPSNSDQTVNAELEKLLPEFTFWAWHTYHEGGRTADEAGDEDFRSKQTTPGLCPINPQATNEWVAVDPNAGAFTLSKTDEDPQTQIKFTINPQFADAMSVDQNVNMALAGGASKVLPGTQDPETKEINYFQVRCGMQLQDINWQDTAYTDVAIGNDRHPNARQFPYLSDNDRTRYFYWKQTHDMDWTAEGNTYVKNGKTMPGVFFSIAEAYASGDDLLGWFSGSYDGGNYTLKNFNIGINNKDYDPNCMGLFGAVKNAELKNIVMFSEKGTDIVTVEGRDHKSNGDDHASAAPSAWYAGGVLVGVAQNSTITNCAVAGYTIRDVTQRTRCTAEITYKLGILKYTGTYTVRSYDMGGAIGGLVGMTDMPLEGCTASANIQIACDHRKSDFSWWHRGLPVEVTVDESMVPVRVGGLVGSTTSTVTNCYTGGSIDVSGASNATIYAGRLIGGVGMEPLGVTGNEATVKNCYSYLTLPNTGGVVKGVYNIGGVGRANGTGSVDLGNNYYLSGTAGGANAQERAVTYRQLANEVEIDGQSIYDLLNAGEQRYAPVTTERGGLSVPGQYSYEPKSREELQVLNYPFPTVLTQSGDIHVHYGEWPLNGITRPELGGTSIDLDMFTKWDHTETLELADGIPTGGTWGYEVSEDLKDCLLVKLPESSSDDTNTLRITAKKVPEKGEIPLTLTYQANGVEYSPLTIIVNVTAELSAKVTNNEGEILDEVSIFSNDVVTALRLTPAGKGGVDLSSEWLSVEVTPDPSLAPLTAEKEGSSGIKLSTGEVTEATQRQLRVSYTCRNPKNEYEKSGEKDIKVRLLPLPAGEWSEDGTTWTMDFGDAVSDPEVVNDVPAGFTPGAEGTVVTLTKTAGVQFPEDGVELKVTLTMEGLSHELTITVPKPQETEAGRSVILSQEGGAPLGSAEEKMEEQPGGVHPDGAAVSAGEHDGGGVGADGGVLQRGQDQEQPGGAAAVPDPVLRPDPDL